MSFTCPLTVIQLYRRDIPNVSGKFYHIKLYRVHPYTIFSYGSQNQVINNKSKSLTHYTIYLQRLSQCSRCSGHVLTALMVVDTSEPRMCLVTPYIHAYRTRKDATSNSQHKNIKMANYYGNYRMNALTCPISSDTSTIFYIGN